MKTNRRIRLAIAKKTAKKKIRQEFRAYQLRLTAFRIADDMKDWAMRPGILRRMILASRSV